MFLVMISSQSVIANSGSVLAQNNSEGIKLNGIPVNLFADTIANRLYVTLTDGSVSIIDLEKDTMKKTINFDKPIYAMDIDPVTNRIYMSSIVGNTIHVIDNHANNLIDNFTIGDHSSGISLDSNNSALYVANPNSNNISRIKTTDNTVFKKYNLTESPSDVRVIGKTGDAYVITPKHVWRLIVKSNQFDKSPIANGTGLGDISVNQVTNLAYVPDFLKNIVLVIDGRTNKVIDKISVGKQPIAIALNPKLNKIYVSNVGDGTVSVINGSTNQVVRNITLGGKPRSIAINTNTNLVYVADAAKKIVHMIDGTSDNRVYGVRFNIKPANSGSIRCSDNQYVKQNFITVNISTFYHRYKNGTDFHCEAQRNPGNAFDHWEGVLPKNLTMDSIEQDISLFFGASKSPNPNKPETSFNLSQHGTDVTAVFADSITFAEKYGNLISFVSVVLSFIFVALYTLMKKDWGKNGDDSSDILTIDGSIIAGVLILLSLQQTVFEVKQLTLITADILFPFASSAILALAKKSLIAKRFALAGCMNFMVSIILLIIISFQSHL
jgi:YVTN family beta-propeller protein